MRYAIYSLFGAIPGFLISLHSLRLGLAWAFVGVCFGFCYAHARSTAGRISILTFGFIFGRLVPGLLEQVIEELPDISSESHSQNERFTYWITARDIGERKNWLIGTAFFVALLATISIAIHDYFQLSRNQTPFLIRPSKISDFLPLTLLHLFAISNWFCGLIGAVFSIAFRRPVIASMLVPTVAFVAMLIAGNDRALVVLYSFGSIAIAMGLLIGFSPCFDDDVG